MLNKAWRLSAKQHMSQAHRCHQSLKICCAMDGIDCRLDVIGATREQVCERHEATRVWGPFNYELSVRTNRGDRVIGASWGKRMESDANGRLHERPFEDGERAAWLIEDVGLSEEIVSRLPADVPTPPPPGSRSSTRGRPGGDSL